MKYSNGTGPTSKSGGMRSHLKSSPGNNPETSRSPDLSNSGKNMPKKSGSSRHMTPPNNYDCCE